MFVLEALRVSWAPAEVFSYTAFFLFPIGWLLLADSIGSLGWGAISYLGAGLALAVFYLGVLQPSFQAPLVLVWLLWPYFTLLWLGFFGQGLAG
ncbi:MAG: hypothetical protein M3506_05805 [Chloroflexota bacterium]|nr:hypothetical protein [Chloroflexota bacterium]